MLEVLLLPSRNQLDREVDLRLESEMEEQPRSLFVFVGGGSRQRTLAPDNGFDKRWISCGEGVCNHASNIMTNNIDGFDDVKMVLKEVIHVVSECCFGVAIQGMRRVAVASSVWYDETVASI